MENTNFSINYQDFYGNWMCLENQEPPFDEDEDQDLYEIEQESKFELEHDGE